MSTFFDQVMLNKSIFDLFSYLVGNYMFKVNNRNTGGRCEICYKLTIKKPERRQRRRSGVFIVNFEHILHLVLVFLYFCIYFEQVNAGWLEIGFIFSFLSVKVLSVIQFHIFIILSGIGSTNTEFQKHPSEVFYKNCVLKIFAKFTGKHLHQSLFFCKVAGI